VRAARFFGALAAELRTHGFRGRPITRRLDDEARRLDRAVGGAPVGHGGGGGSNSSG
jgi:hypothetical protein